MRMRKSALVYLRDTPLEFRGENFHEWPQIHEIRESFLPRKFPAIRYIDDTCVFRIYALIPSEARFLLGVHSNVHVCGFAKFPNDRFRLLDLYQLSRFLHALLRSFPTLQLTDNGYRAANMAKLKSTHGINFTS